MVMLNKVYRSLAGDYRIAPTKKGRYELWVRLECEPWQYVDTFDEAEQAKHEGTLLIDSAEIMRRYDNPDFY